MSYEQIFSQTLGVYGEYRILSPFASLGIMNPIGDVHRIRFSYDLVSNADEYLVEAKENDPSEYDLMIAAGLQFAGAIDLKVESPAPIYATNRENTLFYFIKGESLHFDAVNVEGEWVWVLHFDMGHNREEIPAFGVHKRIQRDLIKLGWLVKQGLLDKPNYILGESSPKLVEFVKRWSNLKQNSLDANPIKSVETVDDTATRLIFDVDVLLNLPE